MLFPPVFCKLALINHMIRQAVSYRAQEQIVALRSEVVSDTRAQSSMHPVDSIESLYDAATCTTSLSEANQVPTPANHQYRALRRIT